MKKSELIWFDLTQGLPTSFGTLYRELGTVGFFRLLLGFAVQSIIADPLKNLPKPKTPAEVFSYHQLKPALVLDDVLKHRMKLSHERRIEVLKAVISESGAKFIASNVRIPSPTEWENMTQEQKETFTQETMSRFLNAETSAVSTPEDVFGFNVSHCHFAALAHALERDYLAPLFCQADSLYFNQPEVLVQLNRKETIAQGHEKCTFRFEFQETERG